MVDEFTESETIFGNKCSKLGINACLIAYCWEESKYVDKPWYRSPKITKTPSNILNNGGTHSNIGSIIDYINSWENSEYSIDLIARFLLKTAMKKMPYTKE